MELVKMLNAEWCMLNADLGFFFFLSLFFFGFSLFPGGRGVVWAWHGMAQQASFLLESFAVALAGWVG